MFMFSGPAWSQTEIFVSGLYPGKGGGFFIPSTPVLGFPGPEKTQIFSFDKNYLSRPVMLRAPSEMKAGGPFYFSAPSPLCPWLPSHASQEWKVDNLAPASAAGPHLPADSSHYLLVPAAGRSAPIGSAPLVSAQKKNAAGNYHKGYHRRRSACRLIKGA